MVRFSIHIAHKPATAQSGKGFVAYLLDSEVHTFAFSVAANAILSFIPFCVLLYTLAVRVFHSDAMVHVIDGMVNYLLPTHTQEQDWLARNILATAVRSSRGGVQIFSILMILVACTGIFLPLEVALNQAWGVTKNRNYLSNQTVAFGLAILLVLLGLGAIYLDLGAEQFLANFFPDPADNYVYQIFSQAAMAIALGVASILSFFSIYWLLPNCHVPWGRVLRTSIVTGILWLLSRELFVIVLPHLNLAEMYGPFFVSVGLLFWAYVSGLILFAGAQFSVGKSKGDKR